MSMKLESRATQARELRRKLASDLATLRVDFCVANDLPKHIVVDEFVDGFMLSWGKYHKHISKRQGKNLLTLGFPHFHQHRFRPEKGQFAYGVVT